MFICWHSWWSQITTAVGGVGRATCQSVWQQDIPTHMHTLPPLMYWWRHPGLSMLPYYHANNNHTPGMPYMSYYHTINRPVGRCSSNSNTTVSAPYKPGPLARHSCYLPAAGGAGLSLQVLSESVTIARVWAHISRCCLLTLRSLSPSTSRHIAKPHV